MQKRFLFFCDKKIEDAFDIEIDNDEAEKIVTVGDAVEQIKNATIVKQRGGIYFGLNMKTGTTYEMNESQFDIVSFFKNDYHSKDELLTYLTSIYDVTSKEIEAEVDFTLNESVSVGLLIEKIAN